MVDDKVGMSGSVNDVDGAGLVEVMFARSEDEATVCCSLLEEHDIHATLSRTGIEDDDRGVAILVPEANQDEALELLALRAQDDDDGDEDDIDDETDDDDDDDDELDDFDDDDDDDIPEDDDE